jgi:hypothetical protein
MEVEYSAAGVHAPAFHAKDPPACILRYLGGSNVFTQPIYFLLDAHHLIADGLPFSCI